MIDFSSAYPNSRKIYDARAARLTLDGPEVSLQVPLREVSLSGEEPPVRLYDTSGPQGHDARAGLAQDARAVDCRPARLGSGRDPALLARRGEITPEMEFVSAREGLPADSSGRRWLAAGRSSRPTSTTWSSSR